MGLLLSVISYQQLSPNLQAKFSLEGASAVIGRADTNDWVLPDSDKILSSRHAELNLVMDKYYITDLSTNGVFINQSAKPLGRDNRHELLTGEQIILGEYVIEVSIESELATADLATESLVAAPQPSMLPDFQPATYTPDAYAPVNSPEPINSPAPINSHATINSPSVSDPFLAGSEMQDSLVLDSNFIPDDWNWDNDSQNNKIPSIESSAAVTEANVDVANKTTSNVNAKPQAAKSAKTLLNSTQTSSNATPAMSNATPAMSNANPNLKQPVSHDDKPAEQYSHGIAALLKGLGIEKSPVIDNEEWWFDLGTSIRTLNEELMSSLRDRAAFKNQFRVNHTMFQVKENNPFKFSASVDDLFRNLYLRSNSSNGSFMSTNKAICEAFADLRQHEQSMRAGLEGAVIGILDQLSPENMHKDQEPQRFLDKFKRSNKEQKLWKNYVEMHEDMRNEITVNRESILSDAFVQAYEDKQKHG